MLLGYAVSQEQHVRPEHVMLLRHSSSKVESLLAAGGELAEYTCVQPTDTVYDFLAPGRPAVQVVAVVVNERVEGVYRVDGVDQTGTTKTLVSPAFRAWDAGLGYPELPARRFHLVRLRTELEGRAVSGWSSPRHPVARYGHRIFESATVA